MAENEHRTGLTLTEQVGAIGQLAAFGVSAAQIAKRTRLARPRVDAALTVAGSTVARAAAVEHDLDLVEAAVVASSPQTRRPSTVSWTPRGRAGSTTSPSVSVTTAPVPSAAPPTRPDSRPMG